MDTLWGLVYIAYIGVTVSYIIIVVNSIRVFKAFMESNDRLSKEVNHLADVIAKKK